MIDEVLVHVNFYCQIRLPEVTPSNHVLYKNFFITLSGCLLFCRLINRHVRRQMLHQTVCVKEEKTLLMQSSAPVLLRNSER